MQRLRSRLALVAACLAGYAAGTWNGAVTNAARDPSKDLVAADREFDSSTAANGVEGWVSHFVPDGIMLPTGSPIVAGQEAIRAFVSKTMTPESSIRWEPIDGSVSGDLGYTYGLSKSVRLGADDKPVVSWGKYVSVWRRAPDRAWRVVVHIDNASPAPAPAAKAQ
jgi:ketosteroid isomerase-like protein